MSYRSSSILTRENRDFPRITCNPVFPRNWNTFGKIYFWTYMSVLFLPVRIGIFPELRVIRFFPAIAIHLVRYMGDDIELEQELRDIYYNPNTGFQSAERLYIKVLENGLNVNRKQVKEWLNAQNTYTRYKPVVRRHKFLQTVVYYVGEQIQMDLIDMGKYKSQNKRYYWILTFMKY